MPVDTSRPMVRVLGLHKAYGSHTVLQGIDLEVAPGEVVCIIGQSGSGKSTLLRCLNGLETAQSGQIEVDGVPLRADDATALRTLRQHVGMIFQSFNLFPPPQRGPQRHAGAHTGQAGQPCRRRGRRPRAAGAGRPGRSV